MIFSYLQNMQSHPSWVCGLKQKSQENVNKSIESHPSWVCGLKPVWLKISLMVLVVTPFVGVWIETKICKLKRLRNFSHTLRGCVD